MNRLIYPVVVFLFISNGLLVAQNIKDETVEYSYIKLPLEPLDLHIKNYQASITAMYEAENNRLKDQYESEKKLAEDTYQKEKESYPAQLKAAEAQYNKEMEEWNKKSLGKKVVEKEVLGANKPVMQTPPAPQLRYVEKPQLKASYDYPVLASTYLQLEGFENKPDNPVKIEVTLYGYDYTQPRQMSLQKNMTKVANGQSQTVPETYYYTEFSYRHPMAVRVIGPDGKVVVNLTPQELNVYKIYKSKESATPPQFNAELLLKTYEERILQENLVFINNLVNDRVGYQRTKRNAQLFYVKGKDETYQALLIAFNDASAGLKIVIDDAPSAQGKLLSSIQRWNAVLQEADPKNKKARINEKVMVPVCFNLLEVYFALRNATDAEKVFSVLGTIDLSNSERRQKDDFEGLFLDLKKRVQSKK